MKLKLILARACNGVIGRDNAIPWHLPEDLAHFRRLTLGDPVIMGRKTWDSLPARFRPLPGRTNIVVTRQPDWHHDTALRADSLLQAVALCGQAAQAWVIGGAQIYQQALPLASAAVVTEVDLSPAGDAFAPPFLPPWQESDRQEFLAASGQTFRVITYINTRIAGD